MKRMLLLAGALAAAGALSAQPAAAATLAPALMNLRAAIAFDGVYTTSTGETVHISVSSQLVPDEAENQSLAEFLASEPHGPEIAKVVLYLASTSELRQLCGRRALACYYGGTQRIVLPADESTVPPARVSILAHEYGHHIARNRQNDPWAALSVGTKRWATYTRVCPGLRSGRLSIDKYELSPSETFAESYRVLVERRLGLEPSAWDIIDPSLEPNGHRAVPAGAGRPRPVVREHDGQLQGHADADAARGHAARRQGDDDPARPEDGDLRAQVAWPADEAGHRSWPRSIEHDRVRRPADERHGAPDQRARLVPARRLAPLT